MTDYVFFKLTSYTYRYCLYAIILIAKALGQANAGINFNTAAVDTDIVAS